MTFNNIRDNVKNMDYSWKTMSTYIVLVPGLSLIVQKIQMANLLPLSQKLDKRADDKQCRKFANVCKWHLRGSMVQMVAVIAAVKVLATPIFLLIACAAAYECADILIKSLHNKIRLYEFHANGSLKRMEFCSACNIF